MKKSELDADPIFAAIELHEAVEKALVTACSLTDSVVAAREGREITEADGAAYEAANAAEVKALKALVETVPTTVAGMRAILEYVERNDEIMDRDGSTRLFLTLLESPILAV